MYRGRHSRRWSLYDRVGDTALSRNWVGPVRRSLIWAFMVVFALWIAGCAARSTPVAGEDAIPTLTPVALEPGQKLRVVASTSIVGDVVANVGGNLIDLTVLMEPGQDPHSYEPTAKDIAAISKAHVIFINGLSLEEGLERTIRAAADRGQPVIPVSAGVHVRELTPPGERGKSRPDPHTWFDPNNVIVWVDNIEHALSALDPNHAADYAAQADAYRQKLRDLDAYIREQVERIPPEHRKLVTDHLAFGYFADRYGFDVIGAVIPGFSTVAEPSASDLAKLSAQIREVGVPAIFVGNTTNPHMTEVLAKEVGVRVFSLYTGSLGKPGSGAETYIGMMKTDVDTIVKGLSSS
ncbi:MAG: zinc ABC transporter substrate-binding protein [Anaerolineae bacterium]|nr:zinc ABC transporter substrate-binding protein [Anaerolineae bacterium]